LHICTTASFAGVSFQLADCEPRCFAAAICGRGLLSIASGGVGSSSAAVSGSLAASRFAKGEPMGVPTKFRFGSSKLCFTGAETSSLRHEAI
jgi:hypothetical protein